MAAAAAARRSVGRQAGAATMRDASRATRAALPAAAAMTNGPALARARARARARRRRARALALAPPTRAPNLARPRRAARAATHRRDRDRAHRSGGRPWGLCCAAATHSARFAAPRRLGLLIVSLPFCCARGPVDSN